MFLAGLREMDFTADAVSEELLADNAPTASRTAIVTLSVDRARGAHRRRFSFI